MIGTMLLALALFQAPGDSLFRMRDYLDLESASSPQISPDGRTVVYTRSWVDQVNDRHESAIWIVNADGTKNRFLTKGGAPVWSPDGTRIAYIGMGTDGSGPQLFVRWMNAEGAASQITHLTEAPSAVQWSPDGKWIGFAEMVTTPNTWAIDLPAAPPNAKWTPAPRVVDQLHNRLDRVGLKEPGFYRLSLVPADGGTPRIVTGGDWRLGNFFDGINLGVQWSWAPDGRTIVISGLKESDGDLSYRDANIYSVDVATGAVTRLTRERGNWSRPVVSPDGRRVAYVGHPYVKQTYRVADLYVMNIDGSGQRNVSASFDRDVIFFGFGSLFWAADGSGLYFDPQDRGATNLTFAPTDGGPIRPITAGAQMLSLGSMSRNGVFAATRTTFQSPANVVTVVIDKKGGPAITQLTHLGENVLAGKRLASAEEIWVPSSGGARVQGWLVKPPNFQSGRKYPMLLEIHGGPHYGYGVGFDPMWQTWAASGYVVLFTNPRGSTGYGTAFGNAIDQAYPGVDYDDLMASVDTAIGRGYIDPGQLFVAGCSGGGALTSWVIGHTKRFTGAAVRCPVIDWISFAGASDVPFFSHTFFAKPFWEAPEQWLKQSPLMYVGNVTTPTLLMTGVLDLRTPMSQTEEYFAALKMRGIPSKLLRFEGEWHGTESIPSNWMRTQLYMMSWFKQYGGQTP